MKLAKCEELLNKDRSSVRVTPQGLEKVPGIFISRMVPGGLAESTGLLAVNDEVLEVNGIEVAGKSLDQVTDMMIANSHNLIITVKPANQRNNVVRSGGVGAASGSSGRSSDSGASFYGYSTGGLGAAASMPSHIIQNFPVGEIDLPDDSNTKTRTLRYRYFSVIKGTRKGPVKSSVVKSKIKKRGEEKVWH